MPAQNFLLPCRFTSLIEGEGRRHQSDLRGSAGNHLLNRGFFAALRGERLKVVGNLPVLRRSPEQADTAL